ncbi:unnamed protein product [Auanema sp. JU1783]|nr:unnamed protein product [Auanema sp. JU1783]
MNTVVVSLFLVTLLHAGRITRSITATHVSTSTVAPLHSNNSFVNPAILSPKLDVEKELTKIAAICLTEAEYEESSGNVVRYFYARALSIALLQQSVCSIGLGELRAIFNFSPLRPWTIYNYTEPSEVELRDAPTLEAYYDLREPISPQSSLSGSHLFEHNMPAGIAFVDSHFPSIRAIFRQIFKEKYPKTGSIDKKTVDFMIDRYSDIRSKIYKAIDKMIFNC